MVINDFFFFQIVVFTRALKESKKIKITAYMKYLVIQ